MLMRICLIVALVAGLAVAVLNFVYVKEKITTLQTNLKTETDEHQKYLGLYTKTDKELKKTTADLKLTKSNLDTATAAKDKAESDLAAQVKRADQLNEDLTKTRQERDTAQADLAAYKATGRTPQQILAMNQEIKGVQENLATAVAENKLFMQKIKKLETELAVYRDPAFFVPLPAGLKFYPVSPCRVADTRSFAGFTGAYGPPSLPTSGIRSFPMPSSPCGIPSTAAAYSVNITAVPTNKYLGWLRTWPAGTAQPVVSTLNAWDGMITANAAFVPGGPSAAISIFVSDPADVFFDINGYFAP